MVEERRGSAPRTGAPCAPRRSSSEPAQRPPELPAASDVDWELIDEAAPAAAGARRTAAERRHNLMWCVHRLFFKRRCWAFLGEHLKQFVKPRPGRERRARR